VQEVLEGACQALTGEASTVHGAGRTDAGVHALRQCAHFDLDRTFEPARLTAALNAHLPSDVAVRGCRPVDPTFHARFTAVGKRYMYRCHVGRRRPVHERALVHWVRTAVDLDAMRRAAAVLVGEHDFAAFATNPGYPRKHGTVRRIEHLHLIDRPHGFDLFVQGNGFLYNMVRTIAGTLLWVGRGKLPVGEVEHILASRDRRRAGPNAPACGLYLQRVLYPRRA
jgi:tRNA pseudouridine38-40 synthase